MEKRGNDTILTTRRELYELVWSKPMRELASELAVSDVGLAKVCKRADIPRPPPGYWLMKPANRAQAVQPLRGSEDARVTFKVGPSGPAREAAKAATKAERQCQTAAIPTIGPLPRKPHLLVAKGFTPIWVSDSLRKRAQAIWHGLLEIFESRGWAIEGCEIARDHYTHSRKFTRLTIDGLAVFLRVRELRRQIKNPNPGRWGPKTELVDAGLLAIDIDLSREPPNWSSYSSKTMKETESRRLEERVGDLLEKLVHMVAKEKVERAEAAERRRLYELELARQREEEARRKAEEDEWQDFRRLAEDWVAADHLRRFVTAIEERAHELDKTVNEDKLAWLRKRIADLDPLNHLLREPPVTER